jgi:hypothetical protein
VLSACGPGERAYQGELGGQFTMAMVNMLRDKQEVKIVKQTPQFFGKRFEIYDLFKLPLYFTDFFEMN